MGIVVFSVEILTDFVLQIVKRLFFFCMLVIGFWESYTCRWLAAGF
jgi:hypothetical protein